MNMTLRSQVWTPHELLHFPAAPTLICNDTTLDRMMEHLWVWEGDSGFLCHVSGVLFQL